MGKKDKQSARATERKAEKEALKKKMEAKAAIVEEANAMDDPLGQLPSFKVSV